MRKMIIVLGLASVVLFAGSAPAADQIRTRSRDQIRSTYQTGTKDQTRTRDQQKNQTNETTRTRDRVKDGSRETTK